MCLISTLIRKVSNTNIFAAPNADKTRQITVYVNSIDNASANNAMVLPVPLPKTVEFIDLSNYKNIFEDCNDCFSKMGDFFLGSSSDYMGLDVSPKTLEIINVGSYQVSLAANLADLSNVDESVFELSHGLKETLEKDYSESHWGFIICKLSSGLKEESSGSEAYHPFAYSHDIFSQTIFIPTKHYHETNATNKNDDASLADDWSHSIYLLNMFPRFERQPSMLEKLTLNKLPMQIRQMDSCKADWDKQTLPDVDKIHNVTFAKRTNATTNFIKVEIHGIHPNIDLNIPIQVN